LQNVVCISEREKYDVSLYPIPWAGSVPIEVHYYFQSPVFLAEEMSLEVISARTRWDDNRRHPDPFLGDTSGWRTSQFGILYGDVIVKISASGLTAEQIWNMLPKP
jgi:hypothetical protein